MSLLALDLTTAPVLGGVAVAAVIVLLAVWFLPKLQVRRWRRADPSLGVKETAELENGARTTVVQLVGGIALIASFAVTWMQIADARRAANRTLRLAEAAQQTERFTRGVNELSAGRLELRLGGVYGLSGVGADSPRDRQPIARILLAYLRRYHKLPHAPASVAADRSDAKFVCRNTIPRPDEDAQATLGIVLDLEDALRVSTGPQIADDLFDLSELDLTGVRARSRDFSGDDLTKTRFVSAHLEGADFTGATLSRTDFRGACLAGARFDDTTLYNTNFDGADLSGADLSHVTSPILPSQLKRALVSGVKVSKLPPETTTVGPGAPSP